MTQMPTLSSTGMFTQFTLTRVLRTVDLDYNNLLIALNTVQPNTAFDSLPLVIVYKAQQTNGGRIMQVNILKAVLISNDLYQASIAANPSVVPFINEMQIPDDYFLPDNRFSQALATIAPTQTRVSSTVEVGTDGLVTVGTPFVDSTFSSSLTYVSTDGDAGTVTYSGADVGDLVNISYVTQAIHPTILITRQEEQTVVPALVIDNNVLGVVMNPTLAGLLGLTLPPY